MDFQQGRAWSCLCSRCQGEGRQESGRAEIRLVQGPEQERSRWDRGCAEEGAGKEDFR